MDLLTDGIKQLVAEKILPNFKNNNVPAASQGIEAALAALYAKIPDHKRISYGLVYTIKVLSQYLFENKLSFPAATQLFQQTNNPDVKGVALGIISFYGLDMPDKTLPFFLQAATSDNWELREHSQMFFKKLIKKYPAKMQHFLLKYVKAKDPNIRRFVAETLRPVLENKWFHKAPAYSLTVLKHLFNEAAPYPRTSVGNNLSDLAKQNPALVYKLITELVKSGDKNAYWIAYRACRNLVKKEPEKVMKLLKTKEYKYKTRTYKSHG